MNPSRHWRRDVSLKAFSLGSYLLSSPQGLAMEGRDACFASAVALRAMADKVRLLPQLRDRP